ncbi:MAG: mechanosensitive ion channel domain-containing protein [Bacteroidota bacterium]
MRKLLLILFSSWHLFVVGQENIDAFLSSPYQAINAHIQYLKSDSFNDSIAAAPFYHNTKSAEEAADVAIKLKQIIDGEGVYIEMDDIPKEADYYDSTANAHKYVLTQQFPTIYLERRNGLWSYSEKSIREIKRIHGEIFQYGTGILLDILPKLGTRKILGLHLYQYLGVLFLAFIGALVHKLLSIFFNWIFVRLIIKAGYKDLAKGYLLPVARPVSLFFVSALIVMFMPALQLPSNISWIVMTFLKALVPIFGTIVFYQLVNILALYLKHLAEKTKSTLDDQLVPLVRKTLKTFVVVIGSLFVLDNLNIDIIPLLTGLSIGGLAFALAAQDTIKNFFGSLMIFVDKPFQIGDWITAGDIDGTVEEVGFRSSRIRTFRNSLMYVPNGKLADSTVDNHGLRQYRRFYTQIALTYDTPPDLIQTFIEGLRKIVENHPDTRKDYYHVYFNDMASFSLNVMFYIFFEVPGWPEELKARHEVLMEIMKLAEKLGVNFAFPTQTLHMENFPGQPSLSPSYISKDEMKIKLDEYFKGK